MFTRGLLLITSLDAHPEGDHVPEATDANASTLSTKSWAFIRRHKYTLVVVLAALIVIPLVVHNVRNASQPRQGRFGRGNGGVSVSVATVGMGDIQVRIPALGTVTPLNTVTVRTQISGQLQKIAFQEGQTVQKGDFLAQIDPRPYETALKQLQGALRRDQALLADAQLSLQRDEELIKEDSVAQQQVDTQRALVEEYRGTVQADEAQIGTATLNLQYTHIVSPITGRIGLRQVDEGNYVTPGDPNGIAVVTQLEPITALFSIPEDDVAAVMEKIRDDVELRVDAYDRSNVNLLAVGKLLTVDNVIDTATGTIKLRAQFDNADRKLFPNQFVNIRLLQDVLHDQVTVPAAAVHRGAPGGTTSAFVYVVGDTGTASVRPVMLGAADGDLVAVTDGLTPGEIVVTEGGDRLRDGAAVILPADTPVHPTAPQQSTWGGQHRRGPPGANGGRERRGPPGSGGGPPGTGGRPSGAGAPAGSGAPTSDR